MKLDQPSDIELNNGPIVVEDLTVPDERPPERIRIQLDELDVAIAVMAQPTDDGKLVASCDLPFLRLGSRLDLQWTERAERGQRPHRGTLDWVALEVSDEAMTPRIKLGLGLDRVSATEDTLLALPDAARLQNEAPQQQAQDQAQDQAQKPALPPPLARSTARRWLSRLALVALGVAVAGAGSAIAGRRADAPQASALATALPVPLLPQIIVTPPPAATRARLAAVPRATAATPRTVAAAKTRASSPNRDKASRARRVATRRARLKRAKVTRYLRWARIALKRRRTKRARHLARLVLLLEPENRSATRILGRR